MDLHHHLHLVLLSSLVLVVVVLLLLPLPSLQQQPPSSSSDVRSLREFKKGIRVDPSGKVLSSWSNPLPPDGCPSSWHGISCDASGNVVSVSLDGLGLVGDLKFSTLSGMLSLQSLTLSGNNLTGRLPPVLGTIASLRRLDLSSNSFYGPIPARMTELSALNHLNLSLNDFEGPVPAGIRKLEQLRVLDLHGNGLWGDVVRDVLSQLRNAEHVDLSGNRFFGELWAERAENLSSLANTVHHLNLSWNRINGGFFSWESMRMFRNLAELDVSYNEIGGELPEFDGFLNMRVLRAAGNRLRGRLPPLLLFGNSVPIRQLDLSGNGFSGPILSINSTSLRILNLSSNALSGSLPSSLGSCVVLDLSRNIISGDLHAMQNWGPMLESVDLSSNQLSGSFLNSTSQFPALTSVRMSNNSLEGTITSDGYQSLSIFDLSLNNLSGQLPPSLFTISSLTYLNLSKNHFTGAIPIQNPQSSLSLSLSTYPLLEFLDLSDNSLSGPLPPDIVSMQKLRVIDVSKNSLSGEIPGELGELSNIESLDLSSNHFSGKIPNISQSTLQVFKVSYNDLSGMIPQALVRFPDSSFHPGNPLLIFPDGSSQGSDIPVSIDSTGRHRHLRSRIRLAIIVGVVGAAVLIFFIFVIVHRIRSQEICGKNWLRGQGNERDLKIGGLAPSIFQPDKDSQLPSSLSFSNDHLLISDTRLTPAEKELPTEPAEHGFLGVAVGVPGSDSDRFVMSNNCPQSSGCKPSPGSPLTTSPHLVDSHISEQPAALNVYSPDRLVGKLFFIDNSLIFTAENLSRAPAEVLGRSSHGTSYKATLDSGHMLTVKWLRVGLVKHKKEFAKEVKRIGTISHPNIISLRCYYWGPREQERLLISDYVIGDSLALHLYETTPRRYSRLTFRQRLKITIDVALCLCFLHYDKCLPHGNLKPTNVLLSGPDLTAQLADYGLHRLMTLSGTCEQMLNLGALGYRAPELANVSKPCPSFKADVFAFGVIVMELLTRRSAGDIISGQSGAVDLTDWVRMCASEGRGADCYDRDISGLDEAPGAMDEMLAVSLRCTLPVNERPNMKTVFEDLCAITV